MNDRRAWALNLDCEAQLQFGASYTRGPKIEAAIAMARGHLRRAGLLGPHDVVVDPPLDASASPPRGLEGIAWCPTPQARAALQGAGARLSASPPVAVLRRVNARSFGLGIEHDCEADGLSPRFGARVVHDVDRLRSALETLAPGPALLKRELSFAGRGHRRVLSIAGWDAPQRGHLRWAENSFADGLGLVVEPLVERLEDYAIHGALSRAGELRLGEPTLQSCDAKGVWQHSAELPSSGPSALSLAEREQLSRAAQRAAQALTEAGYFGPFNVDAFRFATPKGPRFRALVELNARYSMGWAYSGLMRNDTPEASPSTNSMP